MKTENMELRQYAKQRGVLMGEIANGLYISREHFSRLMGKPLTEKMKKQVIAVIDELATKDPAGDAPGSTKTGAYKRGFIAGEIYGRNEVMKELNAFLKAKGDG